MNDRSPSRWCFGVTPVFAARGHPKFCQEGQSRRRVQRRRGGSAKTRGTRRGWSGPSVDDRFREPLEKRFRKRHRATVTTAELTQGKPRRCGLLESCVVPPGRFVKRSSFADRAKGARQSRPHHQGHEGAPQRTKPVRYICLDKRDRPSQDCSSKICWDVPIQARARVSGA